MRDNAKVIVRVRPMLKFQDQPGWITTTKTIKCMHSKAVKAKISKSHTTISDAQLQNYTYNFDRVVDNAVSSQKIYKSQIRQLIQKSLKNSINSTVVAYGQTCSGKTYTLLGVKQAPGVIPCIFRDIFNTNYINNYRYVFKISYTQIYNEKLIDLLSPSSKQLKIVKDAEWGNEVAGAIRLQVTSFQECLQVLDSGENNRKYGQKQNHQRSSRSHTIIKIYIQRYDQSLTCIRSSINVVDLAGSQRLTMKQQSNQQTAHINKSLFQFSNVISKLSEGREQYIPYRDSKLTRLLQNSLTVNSNLFIIFCISPAVLNFNQSVSTLRLASKAKKVEIQNAFIQSMEGLNMKQLQQTIKQQNAEIKKLKQKIKQLAKQLQRANQELIYKNTNNNNNNNNNRQKNKKNKLVQIKALILIDYQNFMISINDRIHEIQNEQIQIIKNELIQNLTQIYQQYSKKITKIAIKQQYDINWLKIQDICFANMLYDKQNLLQYRIPLLKQVSENFDSEENQFANVLQKYIQQMENICNNNNTNNNTNTNNNNKIKSNSNSNSNTNTNINKYNNMNNSKQNNNNNSNTVISNYSSINSNNKKCSPPSKYYNYSPIFEQSRIQLLSNQQQNKAGSKLLAWGCRKDGRVYKAHQQHNNNKSITVQYNKLEELVEIECGAHHSLAVNKEGEVWGWGKNQHRQIINSKQIAIMKPQRIIMNGIKIKQVAAGWAHSLLLSSHGDVYSYGYGEDGQLGHGTTQSMAQPTMIEMEKKAIAIYAGHSHSGFIDSSSNYYAFGFNKDYRLMIAQSKQVLRPKRVNITNIHKAALGISHSCLLTKNGKVYCGGVGTNGELGIQLNPTITGYQTIAVNYNKNQDSQVEKVCPLLQLQYNTIINNNKNSIVIDISCGQFSTAIITSQKQLYTFGKSTFDRVGHSQPSIHKILDNVDNVKLGYRHGFAWNSQTKEVYGWGFNMYNQLGTLQHRDIKIPQLLQEISTKDVIKIATGFFHSLAIIQ